MAQPQAQMPQQAFSPQPSPSPVGSQSAFAPPPAKRPKIEGGLSQPDSPYAISPYAASPVNAGSPMTNAGSPQYSPNTPGAYGTPYTNGNTNGGLNTPGGLSLPDTRPSPTPNVTTPQSALSPAAQYTTATMMPLPHTNAPQMQRQGVMGPPQKPAERPTKDYEYDVTDSLAGTGIDLRAEEQYMAELYADGYDGNRDARSGYAQYPPGGKSSFYGAGPANQDAQDLGEEEQRKFEARAAEKAWAESAMRLGSQRAQELKTPFLLIAALHRRAERIAQEHHLTLNLEMKNGTQGTGKMRAPEEFTAPTVTVGSKPGPDSVMVQTMGSLIPHDAYLVDQLALLSIGTKHRLRELVEDASVIATMRQKSSHGDVPTEWAEAAAPINQEPLLPMEEPKEDATADPLAATSPGTNPLKRSSDSAGASKPPKMPRIASYMTMTMRDLAKQEREWEEARLRKRQKRKDGVTDAAPTPSRSGSAAPATPGSVAPEPEKISKKEMKKNQAAKAAELNSHANQNMTSSMFAGLGGKGGLFGKKKTGKTYDWMNVGRSGSGTNTPSRNTPGPGGKGGPGPGTPGPVSMALTTEGRNRLGTWREDKEKGKNIQLRDWVVVLERDGREVKTLQKAYVSLDASTPR